MNLQDKLNVPVTIDGKTYPHVRIMSIKRNFSVVDGKNAGRSTAGGMIRDIIGTYYNYTVSFRSRKKYESEYNELYDVLSAPVDYHTLSLPYANKTITQKMYVTGGSDDVKQFYTNGENRFYEIQVNFIAMTPFRLGGETV